MPIYTAAKSQSQGRPGWSINFRHPLRRDARNKPGLKVRRGLGTTDAAEAEKLVGQMNTLLADERWWGLARRVEAAVQFDTRVIDAFYDEIEPASSDSRALRQALLPLPGREDGYSRVLLVGTTGAGKTSLVRHLIGTDPEEDRFPSTSTAKTTIADTEVVIAPGPYRAAVTFFSEADTRIGIEECIFNACAAVLNDDSDERIIERLLNHPDQRLRLSYVLGSWKKTSAAAPITANDDWDFGGDEPVEKLVADGDVDAVPAVEANEHQSRLRDYLARVRNLTETVADPVLEDLDVKFTEAAPDDQDAALELVESELGQSPMFSDLANDIIDDILSRVDLVKAGRFDRKRSGWPVQWTFETIDRKEFIRQVRWFSSNYAPSFGRLLTPLVDGVRVSGPFAPTFTDEMPRLVLIDGQGLGHTPDSSASVTTQITRRFSEADVIVLVDNAEQPVQASPLAVLSAVGTSGHYGKLAVVFTHFDQIKGDNLPGPAEKRQHVLASVRNGVGSLRETIGGGVANSLLRAVEHDAFMLGGLQWHSDKLPGAVKNELRRLIERCLKAVEPPKVPEAAPVYSLLGLDFAIQAATMKFHDQWSTRLGLTTRSSVPKAHWASVKALNRRIVSGLDSYGALQPVADIIRELQTQVSRFLDSPARWTREPASEDEVQEALASVRQAVFSTLHDVARERIIEEEQPQWHRAYDLHGKGSTFERAGEIKSIFEDAAPVPGPAMAPNTLEFLQAVRGLVADAIEGSGGSLEQAHPAKKA
jgi:energy-coupling factor transporter ATP-binding protein EcfA2